MVNVLPEAAVPAGPSNKVQCARSKKKGYYEAFRLLLANLVKADWQPTSHPPTERASVRRCLKNERHGRDNAENEKIEKLILNDGANL